MGLGEQNKPLIGERNNLSGEPLRRMVLDFVQMGHFMQQPLVFDRSDGVWLWDVKGNKYLDGISGVWVMNFGHNNLRIINAMKSQLDQPGGSLRPDAVSPASLSTELERSELFRSLSCVPSLSATFI